MKKLSAWVATILAFCILCIAASATYHQYRTHQDNKKFPAPGKLVNVQGKDMHIDCRGSGSPMVVLEAGLAMDVVSWGLVHDKMAETTRVCTYDRPGLGWSELNDSASSTPQVAKRLGALLDAADIEKPIVLVGMSAGGVYAREFQRQFPDSVSGMVFVDSSHEQQGNRLPEFMDDDSVVEQLKLCKSLAPFGIVRLLGVFEDTMANLNVPEDLLPGTVANMNKSNTCTALLQEMQTFPTDVFQTLGPSSLGNIPIIVLTQGKPLDINDYPEGTQLEQLENMQPIWMELQKELVALSTNSQHIVAEKSGHVIQYDQPELVIKAVHDIVDTLRR